MHSEGNQPESAPHWLASQRSVAAATISYVACFMQITSQLLLLAAFDDICRLADQPATHVVDTSFRLSGSSTGEYHQRLPLVRGVADDIAY
jgi:hypothetical protein